MTGEFINCYKALCGHLGIEANLPPLNVIENLGDPIAEVLYLSGIRHKKVVLSKNWWKHSGGAMLGKLKDGTPITILPHAIFGYSIYNPKTDTTKKADAKTASEVDSNAMAVFRTFPPESLKLTHIAQFLHRENLYKEMIIVLLCSLVASIIQVIPAIMSEEIFNTIIPQNMRLMLLEIVIILIVFEVVNIGFSIMANTGISRIGTRAGLAVYAALSDRLLYLKMPFFNKYTTGEILQKIKGIEKIKKLFIENNLKIIVYNVFVFVEITVLFTYCAPITPTVLMMFAGLIIVYAVACTRKYGINLKLVDAENRSATFTHQSIHAMHRIAISCAQTRVYNVWSSLEAEKRMYKGKIQRIDNALNSLCNIFKIFSTAIVYLLIMNTEGVSMGAFIAYISTFFILQYSVLESLKALDTFPEMMSIYKNIKPILESPSEYSALKSVPNEISGTIEFNHVTFRYSEFGRTIVNNVSFKIEEGESLGILGQSGSGKSTLLKLLMGFYSVTGGKIYYGGHDLETIDLRYLRKNLGVVVQHGSLTTGDIYSNITDGCEDVSAEAVIDVIKTVGLMETVYALPEGIRTKLEEHKLSHGEMQKLLIARAIVKKSKFIFLDEATSHLDNESQGKVIEIIKNIPATKIIIAQRLETVRHCDRIITIENGEIVNV
jgi:ATP-binding cassette subfamily C protein